MSKCKYCREEAGFLRYAHRNCHESCLRSWGKMKSLAKQTLISGRDFDRLSSEVSALMANYHIPEKTIRDELVRAWETQLNSCLEDNVLTAEEEGRLIEFTKQFSLAKEELNRRGALTKAAKAHVLREVLDGRLPPPIDVPSGVYFNLQKSEQIVWLFTDVSYSEEKTRRTYVGRTSGFSFRVAKGVYYRVGGFRGQPVEQTQMEIVDSGTLAITNKNVYFAGSRKSFRIPYKKIASFTPYSDGIGINKDAVTAKPQIFQTGDGWFTFNLVVNLSEMELKAQ